MFRLAGQESRSPESPDESAGNDLSGPCGPRTGRRAVAATADLAGRNAGPPRRPGRGPRSRPRRVDGAFATLRRANRLRVAGGLLLAVLAIVSMPWTLARHRGHSPRGLGERVGEFAAPDARTGVLHRLSDHSGRIVVAAFVGAGSALADDALRRLAPLADQYELRDVDFLAIDSNSSTSIAGVAAYARASHVLFPILKDAGNRIADQLQVECAGEVLVVDGSGRLRYRGAIDDQYGRGTPVVCRYLADAIEDVLADRAVRTDSTAVPGSPIELRPSAEIRALAGRSHPRPRALSMAGICRLIAWLWTVRPPVASGANPLRTRCSDVPAGRVRLRLTCW